MTAKKIGRKILRRFEPLIERFTLPPAAKAAWRQDGKGLPPVPDDPEQSVDCAAAWLKAAQDNNASGDGGVARHFSVIDGWGTSYPETTGYIVPTMIDYGRWRGDEDAKHRARRMLDWLVSIQLEGGGFQGGRIDSTPVVPVTFNTGQILIGLAAGARDLGPEYRAPMCRAADWLTETQDEDGCWRRNPTPFAEPGEKAYETHVAWGLLEAARIEPERPYGDAGLANVRWALQWQQDNGWLAKCCLSDPTRPLTHTLGYALRGILEAYRYKPEQEFLDASIRLGDGLLSALGADGYLPGRLRQDWSPAVSWACLTGSVQIAHCWLILWQITGQDKYREGGYRANEYVRRTVSTDGPAGTRGGVRGSFPINGDYGRFEYLNWAAKFFIDSSLLEFRIRRD